MELICNFCGGTYEYRFGKWICSYCRQPKPEELSNEEVTLLYQAGQKLRLQDFEEAEILFADIVQKYPHNPEGYWGLVCAKYGIKYEEDYDGKKIPTCCLDTIPSFGDDANYKKALRYASAEQKKWYQEQAAYVERVSKQWKEDASKEKPYDIFICFKDSDQERGIERTQDSVDATDMYLKLTEKGYRVFMSRVSLQNKTGEKYEPYIFQALQTAKVMIVFGSSVEYITSTWLQNEWKRYLKRMANGEKEKNSLVVAYKGFKPAQMPSVLSKTQCLDFAKNDFYQLLLEYLQNFFQRQPTETSVQERQVLATTKTPKQKPVLEINDSSSVIGTKDTSDRTRTTEKSKAPPPMPPKPTKPQERKKSKKKSVIVIVCLLVLALIGAGIAVLSNKKNKNTYTITYMLDGGTNATDNPTTYTVEDEITLQDATKVTNKEVLSTTYVGNGMYSVKTEITAYTFLGWYTENTYQNKVETISGTGNRTLYAKWSENVTTTTTTSERAYNRDGNYIYFGTYPQTKVSNSSTITALNNAINFSVKKPTNGNNNGWTSYEYYISSSNSTDFMWYIDKEYNGNKYRGVYFTSYRPCLTSNSSSADYSYQDNNGYLTDNIYWFKFEPIKWKILEEKDGYATILAELILDSQQYDYDSSSSNNYANSTIRAWLNDTFYNTAFTSLQQALIQTVTVDNSVNSTTDTGNNITKATMYACGNTNDKVWLLSEYEVTKSDWGFASYSTSDRARRKTTSDYARCQGAYTNTSADYNGKGWWWLRSPSCISRSYARGVDYDGRAAYSYNSVYYTNNGVVPALKIKLS